MKTAKLEKKARGRAFLKGVSGNPAGRPPGALSAVTEEVRAAATRIVEDDEYRTNLVRRLKAGTAGPMEPLLWRYAYGDPSDLRPPVPRTQVNVLAILQKLPIETVRQLRAAVIEAEAQE